MIKSNFNLPVSQNEQHVDVNLMTQIDQISLVLCLYREFFSANNEW